MCSASAALQIETAAAKLDAWLETMRGPGGYGGPVAHWWQQSLIYTGAGHDWRYEGITIGYLELWKRTGDARWLAKACRAGDDLLDGQLEDAHYAASAFEMNPATAGTPHEAACDVALLSLALALQEAGNSGWAAYAECAERNLQQFYIRQLWDAEALSFSDAPGVSSFVPNKAATACEALFLLATVTRDEAWVERYALPTLNRILQYQVRDMAALDGAIAQNSIGKRRIDKYFPIYIARCVAALLWGYCWTNKEIYAAGALRAMAFVARWAYEDGSLPTVVYPNRRVNRYPAWIAAVGDILRAVDSLRAHGFDADFKASECWLLAGQDESGGIQTAYGFAAQAGGKPPVMRDVRDVLHVVGWCDKAFRYLASHVGSELPSGESRTFEQDCAFYEKAMRLVETQALLEVSSASGASDRGVAYRVRKGAAWPSIAAPEFWLK